MKIIFMGTPEFACPSLHKLLSSNHEVVAVFTQAPKPKGRGMHLMKSPIHILAEEYNIPVYNPSTLKTEDSCKQIYSLEADIIIVVAYGFIIPKSIIECKKYGCLNIHPSKLPKFRGAAPLQRTLLSGDKETAVCIMQMDEGIDTGDIILQENISLPDDITLELLHNLCASKGAELLLKTLDNIDSLPRIPQSTEGISYASKLTKEEGKINWYDSVIDIDRKIRALNPWPGTYCNYDGQMIKILQAKPHLIDIEGINPGMIVPDKSMVVCSDGMLEILSVQKTGGRIVSFTDFMRGVKNTISSMDM